MAQQYDPHFNLGFGFDDELEVLGGEYLFMSMKPIFTFPPQPTDGFITFYKLDLNSTNNLIRVLEPEKVDVSDLEFPGEVYWIDPNTQNGLVSINNDRKNKIDFNVKDLDPKLRENISVKKAVKFNLGAHPEFPYILIAINIRPL